MLSHQASIRLQYYSLSDNISAIWEGWWYRTAFLNLWYVKSSLVVREENLLMEVNYNHNNNNINNNCTYLNFFLCIQLLNCHHFIVPNNRKFHPCKIMQVYIFGNQKKKLLSQVVYENILTVKVVRGIIKVENRWTLGGVHFSERGPTNMGSPHGNIPGCRFIRTYVFTRENLKFFTVHNNNIIVITVRATRKKNYK